MRALTYESLVDTENKYSIAKAEKDIISGQLAILKKFAKATKYYQQLSSLLEQQKKLAENIQQSSNANQLLEHLQQQLPSEIAQIEQQINNYQRQLATAQRQTSDIAQNYAQALSKMCIRDRLKKPAANSLLLIFGKHKQFSNGTKIISV